MNISFFSMWRFAVEEWWDLCWIGRIPQMRVKPQHLYMACSGSSMNIYWTEVKWSESCSVVSNSLQPHGLYSPWDSPSQHTGVGRLFLLQGIFPTQGLNPGLPHCRWILYELSRKGSPRILEWLAYPFSSGSSQPRSWTWVSCIAGRFFTIWALREALFIELD